MAGLLPTTSSTSGVKPATNSSRRIASTFAYKSENQCFMAACSYVAGCGSLAILRMAPSVASTALR